MFNKPSSLSQPAVAVMGKVPGAAPVKTRLHGVLGPEVATDLYRAFLLDRLDAVAACPGVAPVFAFTPPDAAATAAALAPPGVRLLPQRGADLTARLINVFTTLLGEGRPAVIATDADSPTLPMARVHEAAAALAARESDVVIGPSADGGYYLVGITRVIPELFEAMPWSTPSVCGQTLARARALGLRAMVLPAWFDVDTPADLAHLAVDIAALSVAPRTLRFVAQLSAAHRLPGARPAGPRQRSA